MSHAKLKAVLEYYDGPQVIELQGLYGESMVGVLLPEELGSQAFLVVPVSPLRLSAFKWGDLDLLDLILDRPTKDWFIGSPSLDEALEDALTLVAQDTPLREFSALPLKGYRLGTTSDGEELSRYAAAAQTLVADLSVALIHSPDSHHIPLSTWVRVQTALNRVLNHCAQLAVKGLKGVEAPRFETAIPLIAGSVTLRVQAAQSSSTLFPHYTSHIQALSVLDTAMELSNLPDDLFTMLRTQGAGFAKAFADLIKTLNENDLNFRQEWADPYSQRRGNSRLRLETTRSLCTRLADLPDWEENPVEFTGTLEQVDLRAGTWRLITTDSKVQGVGVTSELASGLTLNMRYRFLCVERLQEDDLTGTPKVSYTVLEISEAVTT